MLPPGCALDYREIKKGDNFSQAVSSSPCLSCPPSLCLLAPSEHYRL